jgi:hypothetical protein
LSKSSPTVADFTRPLLATIVERLGEPRRFIQVLAGPRQVGKTTLAQQALARTGLASHYASADQPTLRDRIWLEQQWEIGRLRARESRQGALLVLDEIQKIPAWSETVKAWWDEDTARRCPLRVVVLGSAPLLVQRGLADSLAGRFEILRVPHWSYAEMRDCFGWTADQFVFYGGYPGPAPLITQPARWARYIVDGLVETTVSRDILLLTRVDKPALLRRLLELGCTFSGQVLSFQKMLGQLSDAGNTTTLAHYLELLAGAGLLMGIPKYAATRVRQRASSPKLQVLNTALLSALSPLGFEAARADHEHWGRLVESAVGAHLVNAAAGADLEIFYWRERNHEVDFVLRRGRTVVGIEVKSGRRRDALPGAAAFSAAFKPRRMLVVGPQAISLEEFLLSAPARWLDGTR